MRHTSQFTKRSPTPSFHPPGRQGVSLSFPILPRATEAGEDTGRAQSPGTKPGALHTAPTTRGVRGDTPLLRPRCEAAPTSLAGMRTARSERAPALKELTVTQTLHPPPSDGSPAAPPNPTPRRRLPRAQSVNRTPQSRLPRAPLPSRRHSPSSPGRLLGCIFLNDLTFSFQMVPPGLRLGALKENGVAASHLPLPLSLSQTRRLRPN